VEGTTLKALVQALEVGDSDGGGAVAHLQSLQVLVDIDLHVANHVRGVYLEPRRPPQCLMLSQVEWEALIERVGKRPHTRNKGVRGTRSLE
jgi:hypothetical protein